MNNLIIKLLIFFLQWRYTGRKWYQFFSTPDKINNYNYVNERGKIRTELMLKAFDNFKFSKNDVVLDVGSNAGYFGIYLSKKVSKIIGIEIDKKFHRQAIFLKRLFSRYMNLDNHIIINGDVNRFNSIINEVNIIILSKVIYHKNLDGNQVDLLDKLLKKNIKTIFLQGHTTQGYMGNLTYMKKILKKNQFKIIFENKHYEYPILVGRRN